MKGRVGADIGGETASGRNDMFDHDWEVFVIFQDPLTGKFKGQTLCCESASLEGCGDNGPRTANSR